MAAKVLRKLPPKPPKRYSSDPSERAKELVAEKRFGGRQPGAGRPKKSPEAQQHPRPAAAHIAAGLPELAPKMLGVIKSIVDDDSASDSMKLRAIKVATGIETKEAALEVAEADQHNRPALPPAESREEAVAQLAAKLADNPLVARRLGAVLGSADASAGIPPKSR